MSTQIQSRDRSTVALTWQQKVRLLQAGAVLIVLGLWTAAGYFDYASPLILPPPLVVIEEFSRLLLTPGAWGAAWVTTYSILAAFFLAAGIGLVIGFLFSRNLTLAAGITPILAWGYIFPFALLYPLFILWFGAGPASKIAYALANAVFPIAYNTMRGLSNIDKKYLDIGKAFGASKSQIDWHIKLGAAWPLILSGLRIGAGMATVTVVLGEVLGSDRGLGFELQQAVNTFRIPTSYGYIFMTILVTSVLLLIMEALLKSDKYE